MTPRNRKKTIITACCILIGICIVLLWPGQTLLETNLFIPIVAENLPSGLAFSSPLEKGFEIRVRGPKHLVEYLPERKIAYRLDLSDAGIGIQKIPINPSRIPLPEKIEIIRTVPSYILTNLENEMEKKVPVAVSVSGKAASGFFVSDTVSEPAQVVLRGPKSIIDPINKMVTKPIDIGGSSESFKKETSLELAEGLTEISTKGIILAKVFIEEKVVTKTFDNIPVRGKGCDYHHEISPDVISIEVKGPVTIIEKLSAKSGIDVCVDLKTLQPGVYVRCASITLPNETTLTGVNPEIFTVSVYP